VHREITARAPTRIDLGGGWTDVPPYCNREGGFVCSLAINRYALARVFSGEAVKAIGDSGDGALVRAVIRHVGIGGVGASLHNDFPVAAGLGGSSAASAALLGAFAEWNGLPLERAAIAEQGRRIEVEELGVPGGRQDHYAATHGGALALTFTDSVAVERISIPARGRAEFLASATLIYSGESRISGDTITAVLGAYQSGDPGVIDALRRMRELAMEMAAALRACDLMALGELVDEHWHYQRSLHPSIPTRRIDEIVSRARHAGALGAKAMGASGGGCVLILSRPGKTSAVREAVSSLGEILEFGLDDEGLTIVGGR
jgi:D-glycero-alpha-D-manno-heptose-7-phosphate kinase